MRTLLKLAIGVLLATGLVSCGDEPKVPSEPADLSQWCDFERPRQDCTFEEPLLIKEVSDIEPVCASPCTRARNLLFENDGTRALAGLQGFVEIDYLTISPPDSGPTNLEGLEDLEQVGGALSITSSQSLESLDGLDRLRNVGNSRPDESGEFYGLLIRDSKITSLDGLDSLETIESLAINNAPVSSLAPMEGVEIQHSIDISFTRVGAIEGLVVAGETELQSVRLSNNDSLTSIPALLGIRNVVGATIFESNPKLSRCDIDAFVDGLETKPSAEWIRISGNMPCER